MVISHSLNSCNNFLIKIMQHFFLLVIVLVDSFLISHLDKLFIQLSNYFKELLQLYIYLVAFILFIEWHWLLWYFRLVLKILSIYTLYCEALTTRLYCAFFAVVHVLVVNTDEEFCRFCWMALVWAEIVLWFLHRTSRNTWFYHGNLSSWRSRGTNHGFPSVADSIGWAE